ncbi:hypothetical protein Tco_0417484 [Tanacetum coccineum]
MLLMQAQENGVALDEEQLLFIAGRQGNAIDEDVDEQPVQDLALNVDNVFQADDCDAFDSDVDEASPGTVYRFGLIISSSSLIDVQPNYVVDSHANYTSDSNMISYDQYVKDNAMPVNKVAIGYKNPLCLTHAKQVQPALYNGYEIIKNNHVSALVHSTEDTLEIAKITRRKMNDKMKDPEYVTHKVKIAPPDYSKENYLATFTPQKQLTVEQIFWSQDLIKMKEKALKEHTTASRPIKALMVLLKCMNPHHLFKHVCLELEAELSKLRDKVQKDDHTELVKHFSNLEVNHLNLQLKYQNLKESFGNNPSPPAQDTPDFDSVFILRKMKASIQGKDNAIKKLRTQISQLKETYSEADRTLDFRTLDFQITQLTEKVTVLQEQNKLFMAENEKVKQHYQELYDIDVEPIPPHNRNNREVHLHYLKHLKESVETLREIVEEAKVELPLDRSLASACLYTKHSQELLEYAIDTCPKDFNQRDKKHAPTPLIKNKQVTFEEQCDTSNSNTHKHVEQLNTQKTNVPVPPSTGVNCCTNASGSQPRRNTKKNRISPAKGVNKKKVEEHPRTNKPNLRTTNRVDSSSSSKRRTDRPLVFGLRLFKTYDGDRSRLRNFMNKFTGTVRFGNDHFGTIMGYGDYDQFMLVCNTDGVELIKGSRGSNLYTISVKVMMKLLLPFECGLQGSKETIIMVMVSSFKPTLNSRERCLWLCLLHLKPDPSFTLLHNKTPYELDAD